MDEYLVPTQFGEAEFIEKKSRFIGRIWPVETEEEALARIQEMKKQHYDATHNCWAYIIRDGAVRFSDDGEPGGTAGMPIMDTLIRWETLDAIIIVTRYFGGILLGSGGLVRAYSKSASDALSSAGVLQMLPCSEIEFFVDYSRYGGIEGFVRSNSTVKNTEFLDNIRFNCLVPFDDAEGFIAEIIERTDGRSSPKIISEEYLAK